MLHRPALFLDRDGVINVDHGYVHRSENFDFVPGIFELVRAANERNYRVVIVTNQAGIGRGYYSEEQFHNLTDWMIGQFADQGGKIDKVYFCPFHPDHGIGHYKRDSEFRKPNPGMLLLAAKELNLVLSQSILVGDKVGDIDAAEAAGVQQRFLFGVAQECSSAIPITNLAEVTKFIQSGQLQSKGQP